MITKKEVLEGFGRYTGRSKAQRIASQRGKDNATAAVDRGKSKKVDKKRIATFMKKHIENIRSGKYNK